MRKPILNNGSCLLIGFLAMFILPGLVSGLYGTVMAVVAQTWTPVEATIKDMYTDARRSSSPQSGNSKRRGTPKKRTVRRLQTSYTYVWEGDTITNNRVAFLQGFSTRKISKDAIAAKFDGAQKVIAYVNPRRPHKAVLVRGIHNSILFCYVSAISCGLFFTFLGSLLFGYPPIKIGIYSIGAMIVLYIFYFGIGIDRSVLTLIEVIR